MNGGCSRRRPLSFLARRALSGASSGERTISSSRKGCYEFHSKSWLGQCSSGSRLRYVHTSYNQDVVQGIIFERYWSASKLSFGRL